ncbi:MAG: cadmium-translocating P-type ATPase [Psychromonas sp.]|nr:cadmium-translocating P-type ATPase [Psychromonas sp.]
MSDQQLCFHCNEVNPPSSSFNVEINGEMQLMCCAGCEAVAQTIIDGGLISYYTHRTQKSVKADQLIPEELKKLDYYDIDLIQEDFVKKREDLSEISLSIQGITCAACAWLIEKKLRCLAGLKFINVDTTLNRALIRWDEDLLKLSKILKEIQSIGYKAYPFQINQQEIIYSELTKSYLKRIGLAGLATMQVMMFAIALYAKFFSSMEAQFTEYFRWVSLIFATPVLLYSAQPFYLNAWRSIRNKSLGMDIPISIALIGAFTASAYATIVGTGEVYFESVSMFTFLLLLGRLLELRARRKAIETSSNLLRLIPTTATLISPNSSEETSLIPAKSLKVNDLILVKAGSIIPGDGIIIDGTSNIEESMLTGEHLPIKKQQNSAVFAGTMNITSPLRISITKTLQNSLIAEIIELQGNAQINKPNIEILADKVARYFVGALLIIATITYIAWYYIAPNEAFWITLSVLVATCPCALSLATPTALTCATAQLNKQGLLIKQHHVLETINHIDNIIFDKTGTLTHGNFTLLNTRLYSDYTEQQAIDLAAQLESSSEHPIAQAFKRLQKNAIELRNIQSFVSEGLQATYQNKIVKLGHAIFCNTLALKSTDLVVYLTVENELVAAFELGDELRKSAFSLLDRCHQQNISTSLLTGDISDKGDEIAALLKFDTLKKGVTPEQKLRYLTQLQQKHKVMMIGDGINDAPVLAGAHISVTLDSGTDLAKNSADVILLSGDLNNIFFLIQIGKKVTRIIKQNLSWAIGYNLVIIPLAITGHVLPYIAVIGMSFSSLIVVSNSLRLFKE